MPWRGNFKKTSTEYYLSVHDLPIFNWFELNKTGDLSHLLKNQNDALTDEAITAYYTIKDQYFNLFGVPLEYDKHLSSMRYYGLMMAKYLESGGERSMLTHISIARLKLDHEKNEGTFDYSQMWAFVISKMSSVPSIKKMTTFDFMSLYNSLQHG